MTHDIPGHARFVGVYYLPVDVRILRMPLPKRGILHKPLGWVQAVPCGGGGGAVGGRQARAARARLVSGDINKDARRQWNWPTGNGRFSRSSSTLCNLLFFENWGAGNVALSCSQLKEPEHPHPPSARRPAQLPPAGRQDRGAQEPGAGHVWCCDCLVRSRESRTQRPAFSPSCPAR